jgi:hypothetical protein
MKSDPRESLENQTPNDLAIACHAVANQKGFWDDFKPLKGLSAGDEDVLLKFVEHLQETYMLPVKLMLVVTELGEAVEAHREGDTEHLGEEMADVFIRLYDLCGAMGLDIEEEVRRKFLVNMGRPTLHGKGY